MTAAGGGGGAFRLVSLLPSATEIICELGRGHQLAGRSHECAYPSAVLSRPAVTEPKLLVDAASSLDPTNARDIVRDALSDFRVDPEALRELNPDVVITHMHCQPYGLTAADVRSALGDWMARDVEVLCLEPSRLIDTYTDISRLAELLSAPAEGTALITRVRTSFSRIEEALADCTSRPRVAFFEWINPLMAGGRWIPELITAAGGESAFGIVGEKSGWLDWQEVFAAQPDAIIVAPAGVSLERAAQDVSLLEQQDGWQDLSAVRNAQVYAADGERLFNRAGPSLAPSVEVLGEILNPDRCNFGHRDVLWTTR